MGLESILAANELSAAMPCAVSLGFPILPMASLPSVTLLAQGTDLSKGISGFFGSCSTAHEHLPNQPGSMVCLLENWASTDKRKLSPVRFFDSRGDACPHTALQHWVGSHLSVLLGIEEEVCLAHSGLIIISWWEMKCK